MQAALWSSLLLAFLRSKKIKKTDSGCGYSG